MAPNGRMRRPASKAEQHPLSRQRCGCEAHSTGTRAGKVTQLQHRGSPTDGWLFASPWHDRFHSRNAFLFIAGAAVGFSWGCLALSKH